MLYKIRNITARYFEIPIAKFLIKLRISPNLVTLIGLALAIVSAYLIADVGMIGPSYIPSHAHADTLSFELSIYERR